MKQLESSKKAVSITIANGISGTRAVVEAMAAVDNTVGGVGSIEAQAIGGVCANTDELVLLLANNAGIVEEAYALKDYTATNNTYTFHNVSESVTQVAVVRNIVEGEANVTADDYVGKSLETYRDAAADVDAMENINITDIDLYVAAKLDDTGTCTVKSDDHNTEWTYHLFTAKVEVAPTIARVEITRVACDGGNDGIELGRTTLNASMGQLVSGGFDKLSLGKLSWGENREYTYDFDGFELEGVYTSATRVDYEPGNGNAIVWNINPTAAVPQTDSNPMSLPMTAWAKDYKVVNNAQNLTIGFGDAVTSFEPGKIYRLSINFGEDNLDETNEAICVAVEVTVATWLVVDVDPVFGN